MVTKSKAETLAEALEKDKWHITGVTAQMAADHLRAQDALIAALEAENAALKADAERYRFIRDADRSGCIDFEIRTYALETLDEYVDAAIEGEKALLEDARSKT